jgi:hypothetical protein
MSLPVVGSITAEEQIIDIATANIDILVTTEPVASVEIVTDGALGPVLTEIVTGPQGPPGLQNVFIQESDPSKDENGNTIWGMNELNRIWIPT